MYGSELVCGAVAVLYDVGASCVVNVAVRCCGSVFKNLCGVVVCVYKLVWCCGSVLDGVVLCCGRVV